MFIYLYGYTHSEAAHGLVGVEVRFGMQSLGAETHACSMLEFLPLQNFGISELFSDGKWGNCWTLNRCCFPGSSHKGLWWCQADDKSYMAPDNPHLVENASRNFLAAIELPRAFILVPQTAPTFHFVQ